MKNIIGIIILALMLTSCNQTKIGYVDIEEVLKEYKGMKAAEKEIEEMSAKLTGELNQLKGEYQTKVQDYQSKMNRMSAKARQEAEASFMQMQQSINQSQQQAQANMQKAGQDKMAEINETVEDFVKDYAKANSYSYILGTSDQTKAVLYGESTLDVTDAVLEELNDAYKKDKPVEKAEEPSKE